MASKALLSFFLIMFSSYLQVGLCDNAPTLDQLLPGLGQSSVLQNAKCMKKLLPCQPYLKSPNNPPQACCLPLKEMHDNETECLCRFINDPQLLQSFNVVKDDVLKLPEACGIKVDASQCNTGATGGASSPPSKGEEAVSADNNTSKTEASTSSTKMITPYGINYFGVPGFVALLTVLVFSAY